MPPGPPKYPNPPLNEIDPRDLFTAAQAAEVFGVKPGTIRLWVHRGKIAPVNPAGRGTRLYHRKPLAEAERDAWTNGADRAVRGGRPPGWKPCSEQPRQPAAA